ncbi:hypothetical protein CFAM422_006539 [Trichoderma lentiforme]|uniref:Uncharacterized protein n=1 Tax=Trichoderma lentiforme TaxID=1567552 RepID=A0A9P4XGB5_9HYPO|nr:hypothetical protein CFAM422_006539 [Trichoderma lentiforme]
MSSAVKTDDVTKLSEKDLDLQPDDPRYEDGIKCVRAYWAQATRLDFEEQDEMVDFILDHHYAVEPSAKKTPTQHYLYLKQMEWLDTFGDRVLSLPIYLILSTVYDKLPKRYVAMIAQKFLSRVIEDHTQEYFKAIKKKEKDALIAAAVASSAILPPSRTANKPAVANKATMAMTTINKPAIANKATMTMTTINKPAVANKATMTMTVDDEDAVSGGERQVTNLDSVHQASQSVALGTVKRPRAPSDNPAIEPKRTRRATDNDGSDIDQIFTGVKSSLTIQPFADAAKPASTAAKKPRMTSSDLLKMKEDVKIARETAMRNEAKIDAVSAKLDGFISEMRQFMTAFANTAGTPLSIEVIDESDNDNHE